MHVCNCVSCPHSPAQHSSANNCLGRASNFGQSNNAGQLCLDAVTSDDQRIFSPTPALPFLQDRVRKALSGFDTHLQAPDFGHDLSPVGWLGGSQRLNPANGPTITSDEQRLAFLKFVQDPLGFLVQLFGGDDTHTLEVTL